jgi:hypothetical protein
MAGLISANELRDAVQYDPSTGRMVWRVDGLRFRAGDVAGFKGGPGYWQIRIDRKVYYAHRLAVLYMTGEWPPAAVDHIDGNKLNNAWSNLRPATIQQNAANMRKRDRTSSELKGVSWMAARNAWAAHIRIEGKSTYLGLFDTEIKAHAAYIAAAERVFGQFARAS